MEKSYSKDIATALIKFFDDNSMHGKVRFDEKHGVFHLFSHLDCKLKRVRCTIEVKQNCFLVYTVLPIKADIRDRGMMNTISEFLMRANFGVARGNFELDYSDGEIRHKVYVSCANGGDYADDDFLGSHIFFFEGRFETYGDALLDIISNGISAE